MTLTEERRQVEAHHPGWHVWTSDAGKPYATHVYHDETGCGATVDAPGFALIGYAIAAYEHEREMAQHATARSALAGAVAA